MYWLCLEWDMFSILYNFTLHNRILLSISPSSFMHLMTCCLSWFITLLYQLYLVYSKLIIHFALRNRRLNNNSLTGGIPISLSNVATLQVLWVFLLYLDFLRVIVGVDIFCFVLKKSKYITIYVRINILLCKLTQ